ncbi:MAG: protein phosphatase 2C domain-containing protein [Mycobacteriaceae bacterium]|nr:protein phosphatase 2C domain-containing protein [Mycobacteriaceae bacterium]
MIGREPTVRAGDRTAHLLSLTDPTCSVSRTHLEFGLGNAGLWIRDCHSTNGSDIEFDGQRTPLEPGRVVDVPPGSTIHFGARHIRVCNVDSRAVSGAVTLHWGAATRAGTGRERNEDSFGAAAPVFVVADGIGTHSGGHLASREAVRALLKLGARQPVTPDKLSSAIADARDRMARIPVSDGGKPPGTTISGVILTENEGVPCWMVLNLGDSRTYRLDATGLRQLSTDHSLVQKLVDAGVIDNSESLPPLQRLLSKALFSGNEHVPDLSQERVRVGDRILVCSDGLSSVVDQMTIQRLLRTVRDPQAAADALVDAVTAAGGRDDVTAMVVDAVAISRPTRRAAYSDAPTGVITRTRWRAAQA